MPNRNDATQRSGFIGRCIGILDNIRTAAVRRANTRELDGLSDHLLQDIGIDPKSGALRPAKAGSICPALRGGENEGLSCVGNHTCEERRV